MTVQLNNGKQKVNKSFSSYKFTVANALNISSPISCTRGPAR